jgi:hypothetical protein
MRDGLILLWISFVGTLFWPLNPDAAVVIYTGGRGWPVWKVTVIGLAGQMAMMFLLHIAGDFLRHHWGWLDRKCEAVRAKWGPRLAANVPMVAATSGLLGIPPSAATVLLASALGLPARRFFPVLIVFRAIWFVVLGNIGGFFSWHQ